MRQALRPVREFSARTRAAALDRLGEGTFDVVVLGGGINGAGIARDAALRGLSVVLLEQADLASGTSSRSSKLIHGGFRYLEQGQLKLVFEACHERARLAELAPHRVKPLDFLFPVYHDHRYRPWQIDLGLKVYELLAAGRRVRPHVRLTPEALLERQPALRYQGLEGGCLYQDCVTDDALLTIDTARGASEAGALVLPYVRAVGLELSSQRSSAVQAVDVLSGGTMVISAEVVVNATGGWSDLFRSRVLGRNSRPLLRTTRGAHLAFPRRLLPGEAAVVLTRAAERRVLFTIPWGDVILAGTTDTDYQGDPSEARATGQDVAYIVETLNHYFPDLRLEGRDILGTYAGVRPLVRQEEREASAVSREHVILEDPDGLVNVVGGKLTTYRLVAEQVVDRVVERLRRRSGVGRPGSPISGRFPLRDCPGFGAADPEAAIHARASGLSPEQIRLLRGRHPCDWTEVLAMIAEQKSLGQPLPPLEGPGSGHLAAEVVHAVRNYMCLTLADLVARRLWLALRCPQAAAETLSTAAGLMAGELGWDAAETARQVEAARRELETSTAWRGEAPWLERPAGQAVR